MYGLANSVTISENFRIFVVKLQKATERQPKKTMLNVSICTNCTFIWCIFFCSQWFNVLNRVHRATEEELKGMREESANVKHAVVGLFISCAFFVRISISTV